MENDLRKGINEAILKYAVIECFSREMAGIPSEEELSKLYTYSERHNARMETLFTRERNKQILEKIYVVSRNIAVASIVTIVILFGALLTYSDVRAAVKQVIIEWYGMFTRFSFSQQETVEELAKWQPTYLPDSFNESEEFFLTNIKSIEYRNQENDLICLDYALADRISFAVDNEHSDYEVVIGRNSIEYHVFQAESAEYNTKIVWHDSGYGFILDSSIDKEELIKIAESVSLEK